jgi:hypothetical protein
VLDQPGVTWRDTSRDQRTVTRRASTPWRDRFNLTDQQFFAGFDPYAVAAS